jgi:hypothetical protein
MSKSAKCVQPIFYNLAEEVALYTFFYINDSWLFVIFFYLITDNGLVKLRFNAV